MRIKLDRLFDNSLGKAVMMLAGGSILGQLALILSAPILARLFTPADFGILAVFVSLSSMISIFATCRLEYAIPTVDKQGAAEISIGSTVIALANSAVLAACAFWLAPMLDARIPGYQIIAMAWLLALMPLLYLIPALLIHWNLCIDGLAAISRARALIGIVQAICQIFAGLMGYGVMGLVLGYMAGFALQSLYLVLTLPAGLFGAIKSTWRGFRFKALARHRDYVIFNASSSALQMMAQQTPPIIIAALYGPAVSGLFSLGQRVVGMPVRMLAQSASQVFMTQFRSASPGRLHRLFIQFSTLFAAVAILGALPLIFFAPDIFALIFGDNWRPAGEMVQWLTPVFVARFIAVPVAQSLNIMNAQKWHLLTSVMAIGVVVISFSLALWFDWHYQIPIILFSIGTAATFAVIWFRTWRAISNYVAAQTG